MFVVLVSLCLTVADDPTAAVQRRYPVRTVRITTASGTFNYYYLPSDAPPELQRAYRMLEVAEREVGLVDRVQRLKAEYVEREGRLDAARTNRQMFELESFRGSYSSNSYGRGYRGYGGYGGYRGSRGTQGPGWGYPSGAYYYTQPSPLKTQLSGVIAASGVPERAMQTIDRLAQAQLELRKTLLDLAAREPTPPPPRANRLR